ncbi:ADP-ribosylation factor [Colletotrichum incanum]|nr:ADP-ribosylation factor [Colletotrichum incanum]
MASKIPVSLEDKFQDLDDKDVYEHVRTEAATDKARNFVVEFNLDKARIAFDLNPDDFRVLLSQEAPEGTVRWINIWSPSTQPSTVQQIGNRYGFSQRLQAIMVAPPLASVPKVDKMHLSKHGDIESGSVCDEPKAQPANRITAQSLEDLKIYQLVKETVNYTSIDQGKQFLCIGANWLHRRPSVGDTEKVQKVLPPWHWSWLTLCSDSVVVSYHETPPTERPERDDWVREELQNMRSNTLSVLCQLSKHGIADFSDRLVSFKRVRQAMTATGPKSDTAHEGSSNLFYYLFEDYSSAMPVLETSKLQLEQLSDQVFGSWCLEEQKALSDTKDSQATARLSRSATLLAKLSVFFLPITFMTSYFSVEIPDLVEHYTPKMYWICFAVIAGLSFISLFFFSRMLEIVSDTLEGWADSVSRKAGWNIHDDRDEH